MFLACESKARRTFKNTRARRRGRNSLLYALDLHAARFFVIKSVKETKPGIQGLRRTESTAVTEKCRTITHPKSKTVTVKETELLRRILGLENLKAKSTMVLGFSVLEFDRTVGA